MLWNDRHFLHDGNQPLLKIAIKKIKTANNASENQLLFQINSHSPIAILKTLSSTFKIWWFSETRLSPSSTPQTFVKQTCKIFWRWRNWKQRQWYLLVSGCSVGTQTAESCQTDNVCFLVPTVVLHCIRPRAYS